MNQINSRITSCNVISDLLPMYADGICSEETKNIVEEHIAGCDACKEKLIRMQSITPDLEKPSSEETGVIEKLREREHRYKRYKISTGILGIVSMCLVLCMVFSIVPKQIVGRGTTTDIAQSPQNGTEKNEADGADTAIASDTQSNSSVVGLASNATMGDYKVVPDYGKIYDYFNDIYKDMRSPDRGGVFDLISTFASGMTMKEDIAVEMEEAAVDMAADTTASSAVPAEAGGGSIGYSTTNLMTEGVDESDVSKTDGKFIYNATGSEIIIFDIREGEAKEYSRLSPDFIDSSDIIRQIYLDGDVLSIVTEHADFTDVEGKPQTVMLIYDIKDRKNPKLSGSYRQDGTYNTSRKVGDIIYLFTDKYVSDPGDARPLNYTSEEMGSWFPLVNDKLVSADCIYLPNRGTNSLIISSFDQNAPEKTIDTKIIVNDYASIYVGSESIYLYSQDYSSGRDILKISKMPYKDGKITTAGSATVRGYLNDSFAINEYNGYLRLVTTEWNEESSNMLYVLDKDMKECGRISNIAEGESLYACRFMGDTGYFVTYEQTDPLFTVDLKDPKNPKLVGELKVLGFSEYLHFWTEGKMLGIGYDSDEEGVRTGLKLSMFDISDPANVTEEGRLVIKDADYAPGFYDYKAVLASPNANLIGFGYEDYDDMKTDCYYEMYSYEDGSFVKKISQAVKQDGLARIRGLYNNTYAYISKGTNVDSYNLAQ